VKFLRGHLCYPGHVAGSTYLSSTLTTTVTNPVILDPDIIDSQFNHHAVGWALIAIALLVVAQQASPRLSFLQRVWPFIFIAAGIFLMVWSDKEIWPRGQVSWTWLIYRDPEARQHKVYAILLIVMGTIEYVRGKGKLSAFWRRWAFPVLAVFGAVFLLTHDHQSGSGLPPGWDKQEKEARIAEMRTKAGLPLLATEPAVVDLTMLNHHESMHHDIITKSDVSDTQQGDHSGHVTMVGMVHIQNQHLWYTVVGIAVAMFKFLADGMFFRSRWLGYSWPVAMAVLGVLLMGYTE
jgi:hypothetical protein